ncbi:hypothetical protein [Streptomyces sp. NPDC058755]|uniref:hypothetical protein n=1 Tax=unclassified Streptomyces TaxID=2593676 RepID=UPI0036CA6CA7
MPALLALCVSLGALAGSAHAAEDGTLPTATTAAVSAAVQTAVHEGQLVGDDDIHWD